MPDLSCHWQAIILALRDRGGDVRTQLPPCLLFPIMLATAAQAAGTFLWPEGRAKQPPGKPPCSQASVLTYGWGSPSSSCPSRSWFVVWGEEWGESCRCLHGLSIPPLAAISWDCF